MADRGENGRGVGPAAPVVSNASPLIALQRIGRTALLGELFERVIVPPAVMHEIGPGPWPVWVVEGRLLGEGEQRASSVPLDPGEREAIALALDLDARLLLIDELRGRRIAQTFGVPIIGTAGVLLEAKLAGIVGELRPALDALIASGFRLDPEIVKGILVRAGESEPTAR